MEELLELRKNIQSGNYLKALEAFEGELSKKELLEMLDS